MTVFDLALSLALDAAEWLIEHSTGAAILWKDKNGYRR